MSKTVQIVYSDQQYNEIEKAAKNKGLKISPYLRMLTMDLFNKFEKLEKQK
jgi:hypothetical protein